MKHIIKSESIYFVCDDHESKSSETISMRRSDGWCALEWKTTRIITTALAKILLLSLSYKPQHCAVVKLKIIKEEKELKEEKREEEKDKKVILHTFQRKCLNI